MYGGSGGFRGPYDERASLLRCRSDDNWRRRRPTVLSVIATVSGGASAQNDASSRWWWWEHGLFTAPANRIVREIAKKKTFNIVATATIIRTRARRPVCSCCDGPPA